MSKIYTSYFAQIRNFTDDLFPIAICLFPPKWFKGPRVTALSPWPTDFGEYKQTKDIEKFTEAYYNHVLNNIDANAALERLEELSQGKVPVLLCFEKPNEFCHRQLIKDWFNKNGIECKEWKKLEF